MPRRRQAEPLGRSLTGARRSSDSGVAQPPLKNGVLDEINATAKTQFPRRVRLVHLDGLHAEPQLRRDFLVGVADGHQLQHFALAVGDARPGSRAVLCHRFRCPCGERGVEVLTACRGGAQSAEQLSRRALFEHVCQRACGEQLLHVGLIVVTGQRDDGGARRHVLHGPGCSQSIHGGHGQIEYDEVGLRHLREAEKNKRGVIFLTGHLGVWELHSFGWSALEYPLSFLVRPLDNERIEEMVEGIRTRFGNRAIDKKSAARQSLRVLREGGTLGILSDLNTQPNEGVFVPFFGKLACTTAGIATLALKTDAVVIPTCAVWDAKRGKYFFHGDPQVELVRTGDHQRDVEVNTTNFAAAMERMIRLYPEQWLWIHKRWKTRPPGEPDLYN